MENEPKNIIEPELTEEQILERLSELMSGFEYVPEPRPDLVKQFNFLKERLGIGEDVAMYYPCAETDVSLSEAFPNARVIYADLNQKAIAALKENGYESVVADATTYDPGDVDIVVLLNPQIESEGPASHVKPGGYVFANDWHENAGQLLQDPTFECIGFLDENNGEFNIVSVNKDDHRQGANSNTLFVFRKLG